MGRLKGCLWLTAGLIVAGLAGFIAFTTLQRAVDAAQPDAGQAPVQTITVVVASRAVPVRGLLSADDLETADLLGTVPEGAVRATDDAIGRLTLVELYPGEVILAPRLLDPNVIARDGRLALVMAEDQVLMAFPITDLMSRINILKPGDKVDLLFSMPIPMEGITEITGIEEGQAVITREEGEEEQVTFNLLQNVNVAAVVGGERREDGSYNALQALLLTVGPQDALVIKYVLDAGGTPDIVLRAPGMESPFDVDPVDMNYLVERLGIDTEGGR